MNNFKAEVDLIYNWLEVAGFEVGDTSKVPLALDLIKEEAEEMAEAVKSGNLEEVKDAFGDMFWVNCNLTFFLGIKSKDVQAYMSAISKSNYSKFCHSEAEARRTVVAYKSGEHPDKLGQSIKAKYRKRSNLYSIHREEDEKVLKSFYYNSVQSILNKK